jgi:acylphosphatase
MYKWDIYEITTEQTSIQGVMFRGRIRKYALLNNINLLTENASDKENTVRFAIESGTNPDNIINFLKSIVSDTVVMLIEKELINPVLSKMKVNIESRYDI